MKDYKITFEMTVTAADESDSDSVLSSVMSRLELKAVTGTSLKDIYYNIEPVEHLEGIDEIIEMIKHETRRSEYISSKIKACTLSMGMTDEDYKDKPKTKRQGQPKATLKDIATVWQKCSVKDNVLHLPSEQLDRQIYDEVKKQLEAVGGKWKGGKTQGFVFPDLTDANDVLTQLLNGKDYQKEKKDFQFFGTPEAVADRIVSHIDIISDSSKVLEPSAGTGALIKAVRKRNQTVIIDAFEAMPENRKVLQQMQRVNIVGDDFLKSDTSIKYDIIVANPPFSKNQDVTHVLRMYEHLKDGGRLVAIMSPHWQHSQDKKSQQFRDFLQSVSGQVNEIDEGAFAESGTNIKTYFVVIDKKPKPVQKQPEQIEVITLF